MPIFSIKAKNDETNCKSKKKRNTYLSLVRYYYYAFEERKFNLCFFLKNNNKKYNKYEGDMCYVTVE